MNSYKVVFLLPPDAEGSLILKKLFENKFNLSLENDECLAFDYISYKVNPISVEWKLYLVSDIEKFEKIRLLYFTNVHTFVVVLDLAKQSYADWEKIVKEIKLNQLDSKMVCLGYHRVNDTKINMAWYPLIKKDNGIYFEFSKRSDLEGIIKELFQNKNGLNADFIQRD